MIGKFYENLEGYLTCPICLEHFSTTPLTLNCLHSYCPTCLIEYLRVLDLSSEEDLSSPVPVCPSCRAPIYSAKPNALLGNILSDYFAEHPEKRNPDIHPIDLSEATAICNNLLELYTQGMIIPTKDIDGLVVCMMQRVSQEQYERHKSENLGAGMIWAPRNPGNSTLPRSGNSPSTPATNTSLTPEQPINESIVHTEDPGDISVHPNIQLPGPVAGVYSYASTGEYSEGGLTRAPTPATLLHTDDGRRARFFVMQGFDSWMGGDEKLSLEEVWGNWQTNSESMLNSDGQRVFHLS